MKINLFAFRWFSRRLKVTWSIHILDLNYVFGEQQNVLPVLHDWYGFHSASLRAPSLWRIVMVKKMKLDQILSTWNIFLTETFHRDFSVCWISKFPPKINQLFEISIYFDWIKFYVPAKITGVLKGGNVLYRKNCWIKEKEIKNFGTHRKRKKKTVSTLNCIFFGFVQFSQKFVSFRICLDTKEHGRRNGRRLGIDRRVRDTNEHNIVFADTLSRQLWT